MIKAFQIYLLGMWEFRSDWTTHVGVEWINAYDAGREMAHRLTLRRFDL
jgi:hypothetical protein